MDESPSKKRIDDYIVLSEKEAFQVMRTLEQRPFLVGEEDIRISAAGAQTKLMIAFVKGKMAIPRGDTPSTHIIKPNIPGYQDTVWNEYFCMTLAKKVGLTTPQVQVIYLENTPFYVVERYDRMQHKRLHQEDFCQILNIPPEIKYENEGGVSLIDCFHAMDQWIRAGKMPGVDKLRLLKMIIFNFIIGNTDAHGKNFSVIYQNQGIVLAPCYDLLCTMVYSPNEKDKMAMKLGGEYQHQMIQKKHWEKLAIEMGFKPAFLFQQINRLAHDIQLQLPSMISHSTIETKIIAFIQQQVDRLLKYKD
jgi:serine/threonine-protein kinase HipA